MGKPPTRVTRGWILLQKQISLKSQCLKNSEGLFLACTTAHCGLTKKGLCSPHSPTGRSGWRLSSCNCAFWNTCLPLSLRQVIKTGELHMAFPLPQNMLILLPFHWLKFVRQSHLTVAGNCGLGEQRGYLVTVTTCTTSQPLLWTALKKQKYSS